MGSTTFTISTTDERLDKVRSHVKNPETISAFINKAVDLHIQMLETRYLSDFIYYLGMPALAFLCLIGFTLMFPTVLLGVVTGIVGIYLIILFFLFYNKYKKEK